MRDGDQSAIVTSVCHSVDASMAVFGARTHRHIYACVYACACMHAFTLYVCMYGCRDIHIYINYEI